MAYDSSNPRDVKRRGKQLDLISLEVSVVMATPEGRKWVWAMLEFCGVAQTSFRSNPYETAFLCGRQDVGHRLMADIMAQCAEQYAVMEKEASYGRPSDTTSRAGSNTKSESRDADNPDADDTTFG